MGHVNDLLKLPLHSIKRQEGAKFMFSLIYSFLPRHEKAVACPWLRMEEWPRDRPSHPALSFAKNVRSLFRRCIKSTPERSWAPAGHDHIVY